MSNKNRVSEETLFLFLKYKLLLLLFLRLGHFILQPPTKEQLMISITIINSLLFAVNPFSKKYKKLPVGGSWENYSNEENSESNYLQLQTTLHISDCAISID
jgi:hypothetical protein